MRNIAGLTLIAVMITACGSDEPDTNAAGNDSAAAAAAMAEKIGEIGGFRVPESVKYDADLDVYFVTNINGNPSQKDNNGYIAIIRADSTTVVRTFVEGGTRGLFLNAPKGMAIAGDTLFVTDIDFLRKYNKRTGDYFGAISLREENATFLNDVAIGPDGIYVTDTGIRFDASGGMTHPGVNRVFRVVGLNITDAASGDSLLNPNGIAWDAANNRFILAPFGGPQVQTWSPGQANPATLATGPGGYDGVEVVGDRVFVSSWTDSSVYVIRGGQMSKIVGGVSAPADIGIDTKRNVLAIPRFNDGKVEFYRIP